MRLTDACAVLVFMSSCGLSAARDALRKQSIYLSVNDGIKPIERLVRLSFTRRRASTLLLSTGWSIPALGECLF